MAQSLNILPARVPIGKTDAAGNVYITPEFSRVMADLFTRAGGAAGMSTEDLGVEAATSTATGLARASQQAVEELQAQLVGLTERHAMLAELAKAVADLELQLAASPVLALLAEVRKAAADLDAAGVNVAAPTDWEHPGKIGAAKANSAKFTTINRVTITAPVGAATLTLADGKTFAVSNTLTLLSTDGATLNVGGGGTLGTAAYANSSAFAARSATALAAPATDPASTQSLANSLRAVLLSVGIGS